MNDLFAGIISSKTRIKLLVRFFFNPGTKAYLRELSKEFNVSTNAVREELNQLTKTKLLTWEKEGRSIYYKANSSHPSFSGTQIHGRQGHGPGPGHGKHSHQTGRPGKSVSYR
jgi:hypothetical protein